MRIAEREKVPPLKEISEIHMEKTSGIHCFTKAEGMEVKMGWDAFGEKLKRLSMVWSDLQKRGFSAMSIDCSDLNRMVVKKASREGEIQGGGKRTVGKKEPLVVGLDIGTTKICTVVGEMVDDQVNIIGLGTSPSKGLRKGVVINIESTVQSIKKAVEEAELMAGCHITSVYAGIAGGHIKGINSHGVIAVKNREIRPNDVKRVIDAASAVAIPMDREVIHIIPQEFIVDDQDGIKDPVGMSGVRLEGRVHIVTGAITSAQNIIKCANRAGLDVDDIVLEQLGSSEAVLTPEEKDLGVAIIDIGGGTTDLVIFSNGSIKHTAVFSLGGEPHYSRYLHGASNPPGRSREDQDSLRMLPGLHGSEGRNHRSPQCGGKETPCPFQTDPGRDH